MHTVRICESAQLNFRIMLYECNACNMVGYTKIYTNFHMHIFFEYTDIRSTIAKEIFENSFRSRSMLVVLYIIHNHVGR